MRIGDAGVRRALLGGARSWSSSVWRLGTGPFLDGVRDGRAGWPLLAAAAITAVDHGVRRLAVAAGRARPRRRRSRCRTRSRPTTARSSSTPRCPAGCSATSTAACGTAATPATSAAGCGRSAWERVAGQVVQVGAGARSCSLALPSPVRSAMPRRRWRPAGRLVVAGRPLLGAAPRRVPPVGRRRTARADVRDGLLARQAWPGDRRRARSWSWSGTSAMFLIAARAAGVAASGRAAAAARPARPAGDAVPANIGGWGPREGVAAWVVRARPGSAPTAARHRHGVRRAGARRQPARRRRAGRRRRLRRRGPPAAVGTRAPARRVAEEVRVHG